MFVLHQCLSSNIFFLLFNHRHLLFAAQDLVGSLVVILAKLVKPSRNDLVGHPRANRVFVLLPLLNYFLHEFFNRQRPTALFVIVGVLALTVEVGADAWWCLVCT